MDKHSVETKINNFLVDWGIEEMEDLFRYIEPLLQLYNIDEHNDWVEDEVGVEDCRNVRLIRTVYILSRFCETFAGKFCTTNIKYKNLWQQLEKSGTVVK